MGIDTEPDPGQLESVYEIYSGNIWKDKASLFFCYLSHKDGVKSRQVLLRVNPGKDKQIQEIQRDNNGPGERDEKMRLTKLSEMWLLFARS